MSLGSPRFTSKYCCIIGVSFSGSVIGSIRTAQVAEFNVGARGRMGTMGSTRMPPAAAHTTVPLFHREFGGADGPPLVILHGMLGSSRNWQTVGRDLASGRRAFALDLRNHGMSPHADDMSYGAMAADVVAWMDGHGIDAAELIGHSMGGKLAMPRACAGLSPWTSPPGPISGRAAATSLRP